MKTKCPDCNTELIDEIVYLTEGKIPFKAFVCPRSEVYQEARKQFEKKWFKGGCKKVIRWEIT
jgi:hypothetical protein